MFVAGNQSTHLEKKGERERMLDLVSKKTNEMRAYVCACCAVREKEENSKANNKNIGKKSKQR